MEKIGFLAWLFGMMEKVDAKYITGNLGPRQPKEDVVGKLSMELRRMYGVSMQLESQALERATLVAVDCHLPGHDQEGALKALDEVVLMKQQAGEVMGLFWTCVRHETNVRDRSIGIRDDWDVVAWQPDRPGILVLDFLHM